MLNHVPVKNLTKLLLFRTGVLAEFTAQLIYVNGQ